MAPLDDKVVIVTGAGVGIGRAHAFELARLGARIVVNDIGTSLEGGDSDASVAEALAAKISDLGGQAIADTEDVADWQGASRLIDHAVAAFGRLDVLVNNASIIRDAWIVEQTEETWDAVVRVHLKGTFAPLHHAARYWKAQHEAGERSWPSVVNTTSRAGIVASQSQAERPNYAAAKAAIAHLTTIASYELHAYGVRVNAISPHALTRGAARVYGQAHLLKEAEEYTEFDPGDPGNNSPVVAWLASDLSRHVTGHVFAIHHGKAIAHCEPWHYGVEVPSRGRFDTIEEIAERMDTLVFGCRAPWAERKPLEAYESLYPTA